MQKDFYINDQFLVKPASNLLINGSINKISRVDRGVMELLCILAERNRKEVSRDELIMLMWQNERDASGHLDRHIGLLRDLLQDDKKTLIRSVSKKGFSLQAKITNADIDDLTREATEAGTAPRSKSTAQKWIIILSALIVILLIIFALYNYTYSAVPAQPLLQETMKQAESNSVVSLGPDSVIYKLIVNKDGPPRFFINDRELPADQWTPHLELINSLKRQLNERKTQE